MMMVVEKKRSGIWIDYYLINFRVRVLSCRLLTKTAVWSGLSMKCSCSLFEIDRWTRVIGEIGLHDVGADHRREHSDHCISFDFAFCGDFHLGTLEPLISLVSRMGKRARGRGSFFVGGGLVLQHGNIYKHPSIHIAAQR